MQGSKTPQVIMETRLNHWLWLRLNKVYDKYPVEILGTNEIRKNYGFRELLDESRQHLLPYEKLEWIAENKRQIDWLQSYLRKNIDFNFRALPSRLLGRYFIFAAIDIYDVSFERKLTLVEKMQTSWNEYAKEDVVFDWFDKKEKVSRCQAAWDWVTRHKSKDLYGIAPFSNIDDLIIFYDGLGLTKEEKERDVLKIQSFWHQRKNRAKDGGRKQYNFVLSKQSVVDLDKLAERHSLKRPQMLEVLIQNEIDRGKSIKKMDI